MDKKLHLANTNERSKKIYKLKSISEKQSKFKKKEENNTYTVQPQKSSSEKAKQSESYSVYQKGHKKNTVKSDEVRSYRSDDDDSAEKDKYRKQMQFTSFQQKAAEMNSKLSSDIQVNIETAKKQASVSSYQSGNTSNSQYSDKTKEAAAMLASRLAGDILRKTQVNDASQAKSSNSPMGNAKPDKSQRVCFYLNSNEVEKARLMKPDSAARERFNKAADNTYKEREKIKNEIAKETNKIKRYQKESKKIEKQASKPHTTTFEKVEDVLYLEGKASGAVNKGSTGEAAAAISVAAAEIAAKKVIEEAAKNHKSIGEISRASGAVGELSSSIERENSVGSAAASAFTAVPKYYISQKAADTVKKSSQKHYKDKLDKKLSALRAKQKAAEKRIEQLKKEQAKRQVKINIYKAENGITSKSNSASQNIKAVIKSQHKAAKAAAAAKSSATIVAAAGGVLFPILGIVVIIIIIAALFSWVIPHEETFYVEEDNAWEPVMVESNDEILKGYIKHIQDYFDKKQLEILSKVDFEFGGFEPDKYEWNHTEDNPNAVSEDTQPLFPVETKGYYISVKKTEYTVVDVTPGDRYTPSKPIWSTEPTITTTHHADAKNSQGGWDESWRVMHEEYYKINEDYGYETRTTSDDYDYTATYLDYSVDVAGFWNSIEQIKEDKFDSRYYTKDIYRCELITGDVVTEGDSNVTDRGILGHIARDISGYTLRLYKNESMIYNGDYATYLKSHPELFMHVENVPADDYFEIYSAGENSQISYGTLRPPKYEVSYITRDRTEMAIDLQYIPDRHIWNLNEFGNRWIKLSDDCDFEHIIAMAAVKKWQDITADGFDTNTYRFEITDEDLDYCLGKLYEFSYGYRSGQCRLANCQRGGDPPSVYCNRASTHKHLIGQVANLQVAGGIDYVLNRILKMPQRSDYASDAEYQSAVNDFETCKDIYEVYVEYIYDQLGTSTKLSDYENDNNAQYRLLRMYQAESGKKPSNPPKNVKISSYKKQAAPITTGEAATSPSAKFYEHYYITIQWEAPEIEYVSKDETVEITNYDIFEINRSTGKRTLIARVGADQTGITDLDLGSGPYKEQIGDTITVQGRQVSIVMQSVNEHGNSCDSQIATYWLK